MPRILFLTTAHQYHDDRIFYHQAKELKKYGFVVKICSLSSEFNGAIDDVEIESYAILDQSTAQKIKVFENIGNKFQPDCIICSEPLAVIAAKKIKGKKNVSIIYDVTEWYPSKRMVENFSFLMKWAHGIKFFMIQLYAGYLSSSFIFGENTKKFPLAYVFPFKKKIILPYYPDDAYIYKSIKQLEPDSITLCYTGQLSKEKGIGNFFEAIDVLRKRRPDLKINILIIGSSRKEKDKQYFSELLSQYQWENIRIEKSVSFESFTKAYAEADLCFDLREMNYENHHCLPIKIFYYAASGKPVIYTDLKATRQHVEVSKFGFLVDPEDAEAIANKIMDYIDDAELYNTHAHNARSEYEKKYTWNGIRNMFTDFVKQSIQ
ncbi:glycosyl transferase family 1 [Chryseobacterium piperi]|uniref:Glycosyl transferase family 1 n=1 Tax=Chryseobacterium piperi TaxID=558152 RepID=A0A086ARH6_9FLAO|nr:glycosyltransferase [Chryseobacterium piperi]ASW75542.1 glycosyl transferase family 1 [Chryseobacterium piperi]KFF19290.1 glycosyl transferase family 1 [Chryseobacterium piperi]